MGGLGATDKPRTGGRGKNRSAPLHSYTDILRYTYSMPAKLTRKDGMSEERTSRQNHLGVTAELCRTKTELYQTN